MNGKITIEIEEATDYDGYLRIHIPEQAIMFRRTVDKHTLKTTTLKLINMITNKTLKEIEKHFAKRE